MPSLSQALIRDQDSAPLYVEGDKYAGSSTLRQDCPGAAKVRAYVG